MAIRRAIPTSKNVDIRLKTRRRNFNDINQDVEKASQTDVESMLKNRLFLLGIDVSKSVVC